jgi:hypothetical protein
MMAPPQAIGKAIGVGGFAEAFRPQLRKSNQPPLSRASFAADHACRCLDKSMSGIARTSRHEYKMSGFRFGEDAACQASVLSAAAVWGIVLRIIYF